MFLADVALNASGARLSLANRMPSRLLQFRTERRAADKPDVEAHVFERRTVAGLAPYADQIGMRVGAQG